MSHVDTRLSGFLADTWWFGLTKRLTEQDFERLAELRAQQAFSAIQLVVGIPPEVGPENENAASTVGFPWTLDGRINAEYLQHARDRIIYLNNLGFIIIVYGAWGHQIDWLGRDAMLRWWLRLVERFDDLDVIYCLCGECMLWLGEAERLLADKTTGDLIAAQRWSWLPERLRSCVARGARMLQQRTRTRQLKDRREGWSVILDRVSQRTRKPVIIHPTVGVTGFECVTNPELLYANTVQTGHWAGSRNLLWQLPAKLLQDPHSNGRYINLEPWYEGIHDRFRAADQLYAYWVSMLAGASSFCYGAHGIWNAGDGKFLAHWGGQTFTQALHLDTPRLMGLSHRQFVRHNTLGGDTVSQSDHGELVFILRRYTDNVIAYYPDISRARDVLKGRIWLPLEGAFAETLPERGQVVVFVDGSSDA